MPEAPIIPQTPLQQQIIQMALNLAGQLEAHARQAPSGSVLDACESFLLDGGRQFLRDSLVATLQSHTDEAEKKGAPRVPAHAATAAATREPVRANC
jgi:hypothetical protein